MHSKRPRLETRPVKVGDLTIGGDAPVSIQSMTSVPLEDVEGTISQIRALDEAGAQVVRLAVRNLEAVEDLKKVRAAVDTLLTADIHFNHRIAIAAIEAGVNKVRINPGNIGSPDRVREVVKAAKDHGVPIRIGVNGGSLDRNRYPLGTAEDLARSALEHVEILEDHDFRDIVVSLKSSHLFQTIEANKVFSSYRDYPLHIGLTEAGYGLACTVQSSVAIGHLLLSGIGDTIRVSMTGDPTEEVRVAKRILESVGELKAAIRIIACPTCGRTSPDLDILALAERVEALALERFRDILEERGESLEIAVMGCEVNGPGEAGSADFGLAGGRNNSMLLFGKGEKLRKVKADEAVDALMKEIESYLA